LAGIIIALYQKCSEVLQCNNGTGNKVTNII